MKMKLDDDDKDKMMKMKLDDDDKDKMMKMKRICQRMKVISMT